MPMNVMPSLTNAYNTVRDTTVEAVTYVNSNVIKPAATNINDTVTKTTEAAKAIGNNENFQNAANLTKDAAILAGNITNEVVLERPFVLGTVAAVGYGVVAPLPGLSFAAGCYIGQELKERNICDASKPFDAFGKIWHTKTAPKIVVVAGIAFGCMFPATAITAAAVAIPLAGGAYLGAHMARA
jgi:hypothetical protein